jgi:hypothetical protein
MERRMLNGTKARAEEARNAAPKPYVAPGTAIARD